MPWRFTLPKARIAARAWQREELDDEACDRDRTVDGLAGVVTGEDGAVGGGVRQSRQYEIRLRGHLGATMRAAFPALQARPHGPDTVLTGALRDQAALYGVLAEIEALGLELLEVRRLPPH